MIGKKRGALKRSSNLWMGNEQAITEALGALFILAILLTATTFFYARQLPAWTEEFEYQHASKIPQDFAQLGSNLDMALASEDPSSPTSTSIGMIPQGVPLVGIHAAGGTIRFEPAQETFECIASALEPANTPNPPECWNDSFTWYNFSLYHVKVAEYGAKLEPEAKEDKVVTQNGTLSGEHKFDRFIVRNNSILTVPGSLTIHATYIDIKAGSQITADGFGLAGGTGNDPGQSGRGLGGGLGGDAAGENYTGGCGGGGGGGGGEGGDGGECENNNSGGTAVYSLDEKGAGGGGGGDWKETGYPTLSTGGDGGYGGGVIRLDASTVNIAGTISADGADGKGSAQFGSKFHGGGGGGGAGGRIVLKGDNVTITGELSATGGAGGDSDFGSGGGGGGGGVITVWYDSYIAPSDANETKLNVNNGSGGACNKTQKPTAEAGKPGEPGKKEVAYRPYVPSIFYYTTGYIVSNMTNVTGQGQAGYDTNSTLICYGNLTYDRELPPDTDIIVKVRTSMYPDLRDAVPWEDCPPVISGQDISDLISVSDGHQYIQWRAELITFDPRRTPVLHWVNISYESGKRPILVTASGKLEYDSQYLYLPNYQLVYTQGGTIKHQADGGFMLFAPPIVISRADNHTVLKITSRDLQGPELTMSGRLSATVEATYENATLLKNGLNYANITLNLTTSYPAEWERWFNDSCRNAGIPPGEVTINSTGTTLQVIFHGNETKPVNLWLKRSIAEIELRG
jgi:hypothetical protein